MIQVSSSPIRFAIYSGDINKDGFIDGSDFAQVDNDAFNFTEGYVITDVTGDNYVDGSDGSVIDNNVFNFIAAINP